MYRAPSALFLTLNRPRREADCTPPSTKRLKECHNSTPFTGKTPHFTCILFFFVNEGKYIGPTRPRCTLLSFWCYPWNYQTDGLCLHRSHIEATKKGNKKSLGFFKVLGCRAGWRRYRWCYQRDGWSSTDTDRGVCNWPWHMLALVKADRSLFVTRNWRIPAENTLGWSSVVFCACELKLLFSTAFCGVRSVHKFDFRLVINAMATSGKKGTLW